MGYRRREKSESDIYHVIIRGVSRMLIFEDDEDCAKFLECMAEYRRDDGVEVFAWCLMGNHVHLLLHAELSSVAHFMERLNKSYVAYFNRRHDRVGHLLQGRYKSVAVKSDPQLLETVRYIHRNPVQAGLSESCEFPWSSYGEYLGKPCMASTDFVLDIAGGVGQFERLHEGPADLSRLERRSVSPARLGDAAARRLLRGTLEERGLAEVPRDDKDERNRVITALREKGLSIRQIERLTGIGRGIIQSMKI